MGYRSQVCIGMTDDAMRLFRTMLDHVPESHEIHSLIKDAESWRQSYPWDEGHKSPDKDCEEKLYLYHVKWYDGYECIDFVESFLTDCIPEEDYRLLRIGEENEDIEERGDYWDAEIFIQRTISR